MSDINDPVVYEIVAARVKLLFEHPFFGQLAARLELVDATSWCETAATDGRKLYYNREFIKSLSKAELLFLIGHELLHVVYDHVGRCGWRDHKLHNMATDYLVNWTLVDSKLGTMPASGLYDPRFTDAMTSEEIYDILKSESVTIKMPLDHHLAMAGEGDDEEGEGEGDGDGDGEGNGKGRGGGKEIEVTVMGKNGPPKLTKKDIEKIRNEVRAATIQAAQAAGVGNVPAGIRRLINDLVTPQMDWRTLLDAHVRSSFKDDYSYANASRRSWGGSGFIFPGMNYENQIKIAVGIDTSGSMTDEMMRDFLSEIHGIVSTFKAYEIMVFTWDTQTYNPKIFTPMNINELLEYVPQGGGGTASYCAYELLKREGYEPNRLVMMTDGYIGGEWGDPNYCDTLWLIHSDPTKHIVAPFGMTCYYEEKQTKKKAA